MIKNNQKNGGRNQVFFFLLRCIAVCYGPITRYHICSLVSDPTITLFITIIIIVSINIMNLTIASFSDMLREIFALDVLERLLEYLLENVLSMIKNLEQFNGALTNSCFTKIYDSSVKTSGRALFINFSCVVLWWEPVTILFW